MAKLRRLLAGTGVDIRTVHRRGYLMHLVTADEAAVTSAVTSRGVVNVTDVLVDIVVVLLAAKIAAEIAERIGVPAVIGEIVAGIIVGPSVLGLHRDRTRCSRSSRELGVILLLLEVGLELSIARPPLGREVVAARRVDRRRRPGRRSASASALAFGESGNTALFLGTALAATSVGITAGCSATSAR